MSGPLYGLYPRSAHHDSASFTADNVTYGKIVVPPQASAAASGQAPPYLGGCSVTSIIVASTDSAVKLVNLWKGIVLTTQETSNTGTMTTTATTNGTVTRVNGSFITDGWKVGDWCMTFAPDTVAQAATDVDGRASVITAVTATTITIKGVTWSAVTLTAGTRLVKVSRISQTSIALNAGNDGTASAIVKNVSLLPFNPADANAQRMSIVLGPTSMLIANVNATPSATPAIISVDAEYFRY